MANWSHYDANGQKRSHVTNEHLKTLVGAKIITPKTPLETENGQKGTAGQVSGLFSLSASVTNKQSSIISSAPPSPPVIKSTATYGGENLRMDYERNMKYFEPDEPVSMLAPTVTIVIGVVLSLVIIGIPILIAGIIWLVMNIKKNSEIEAATMSDEEMDEICASQINNMKSKALKKLGLDEDQAQEAVPIQIDGYYYGKLPKSSRRLKTGKDGVCRCSNYNAMMFLFSGEQVYSYCFRFSLLEDVKQVITDECFYGDIVSVATIHSIITEEQESGSQVMSIGKEIISATSGGYVRWVKWFYKLFLSADEKSKKEEKTDYYTSFRVTMSGSTEMSVTFWDMATVERTINGMRSLLRNKKQCLRQLKHKNTRKDNRNGNPNY